MKISRRMITFSLLFFSLSQAKAGSEIWGNWSASGDGCSMSDVQVMPGGDALGIIFSAFGINMQKGALVDGKEKSKTCQFSVKVFPPAGSYLAGFKQLYNGGMIKSKGAMAHLGIRYRLGAFDKVVPPLVWPMGQTISPENPESQFNQTYMDNLTDTTCRKEVNYQISMRLTGRRISEQAFITGGLDTIDAQVGPSVCMIPQWKPCVQAEPPLITLHRKVCFEKTARPLWLATTAAEESPQVCRYDGPLGRILQTQISGSIPLYRCHASDGGIFSSQSATCEGRGQAHLQGFVYASHLPGTTPLYRCYHPKLGRHMTTLSNSCEQVSGKPHNGFQFEGPLGFVK